MNQWKSLRPYYKYRFGFNGKEKLNEAYGEGNAYDFGSRIQDARLGKWLSVDPMAKKYPDLSPYVAFGNDPLIFIDPGGETLIVPNKNDRIAMLSVINYAFGFDDKNHGFEFTDDGILHGGVADPNWSKEQLALYTYFTDLVVNSKSELTFYLYKESATAYSFNYIKDAATGKVINQNLIINHVETKGLVAGQTNTAESKDGIYYPSINYLETEAPISIGLSIVNSNAMANGNDMQGTDGYKHNYTAESTIWHEIGHFMMSVILIEKGGNYQGEDFNKWPTIQQDDFSISIQNYADKSGDPTNTPAGTYGQHHDYSARDAPSIPMKK